MSEWTDVEITTMRDLAAKGYSATQAKEELPGRSRNSILGKAFRLGFSFNSQPARNPSPAKRNRPRIVKVKSEDCQPKVSVSERKRHDAIMLLFVGEGKKLLLDTRDNECKWPMGGELLEPMACADPIRPGSSYCRPHHRLAHR